MQSVQETWSVNNFEVKILSKSEIGEFTTSLAMCELVVLLCRRFVCCCCGCVFVSSLFFHSTLPSTATIDYETNPKNEKEAGHNDNSGSKDGSLDP